MYRLTIAAHGDNEALHREALKAAVEAVERVNKAPVYRAYLTKVADGVTVGIPNEHDIERATELAREIPRA
jgi:sugar/nucleoside kinase (ribokinase family)